MKLVTTPSSNSGWHSKWLWYDGGEMNRISPWRRLNPDVVKTLSDAFSTSVIDLSAFCGVSSRYSPGHFTDVGVLCSHSCKGRATFSSSFPGSACF